MPAAAIDLQLTTRAIKQPRRGGGLLQLVQLRAHNRALTLTTTSVETGNSKATKSIVL